MTEMVGVVAVLVSRRDHQQAKAQDVRHAMPHPSGQAGILDAGRQTLRETKPLIDLPQRQNTGIGGELPAIEAGDDGLAAYR